MATNVKGAKITNVVSYTTDRTSLKRVRADLKNLQSQFNKTMAASGAGSTPAAARASVKSARKNAEVMVDNHVKAFNDISKQRAKQNQRNTQRAINDMFGIGKPGKSARESMSIFSAAAANDAKAVKEQKAKMDDYAKAMVNQQADIDRIRRNILAKRAAQEKRDNTANLSSQRFGFDLSRTNLSSKAINKLTNDMQRINERYKSGAVNIQEYREQMRQLVRITKDQSKETMTLAQRLKELRAGKSGGLGAGGLALGLGVAGTIGAGYIGFNAGRNALASGVEQSRGLMKAQTMGLKPQEAQALQMAIAQQTGFTLSYEKISDIAKDTQDKIGQLSMGQWKQNKKDGTWAYSGGGEMSDWLKIMTERGGYSREGSLATLRNVKGPAELAVLLQGLKKSANLTESEFTALAEAINDFSYVAKSIGPDGQNLIDVMRGLVDTGLLYNDQELENMKKLQYMATVYEKSTDALQGKFGASFIDGLANAGITSENLARELGSLSPIVKQLGDAFGSMAGGLLKVLNMIPGSTNYDAKAYADAQDNYRASQGSNSVDSWLLKRWSSTSTAGEQGWLDAAAGVNRYASSGQAGNPGVSQAPIIVQPAPVAVNVSPSPDFGNLLQAHTDDRIGYAWEGMSFDMNSSMLRK